MTHRGCALIAALALLPACADDHPGISDPAIVTMERQAPPEWTLDDDLAALAAGPVPGFAGAFLTEEGELVVLLANDGSESAARIFADTAREFHPATRISLRRVKYSFADLRRWTRMIEHDDELMEMLTYLDADERHNRVVFGVADQEQMNVASARLRKLGVPDDAFAVEHHLPAVPEGKHLDDYWDPIAGGVRINIATSSGGDCSLGYAAVRGGVTGYVSASHCSLVEFSNGTDWGVHVQPDTSSIWFLGVENWDEDRTMPVPYHRSSDTHFVNITSGDRFQIGKVVRTGYYGGQFARGSLEQDDVFPWFNIVAKRSVTDGTMVNKVGQNGGWTRGTNAATCVTVAVGYSSGTRNIYCSHKARYYSEGGDSGGPVFWNATAGSTNAEAVGIHFAKDVANSLGIYSPIRMIEREMGAIDVCSPSCPNKL